MADDHYIRIEIPVDLFKALEERVRGKAITPRAKEKILGYLAASEVVELPMAHLPWEDLEADAERQGISVLDVLYDRAHGSEPA